MKDTVHSCSGKTALVTSAARGTGRAVAVALGKAGAQVLVHHTRSPAAADQTVSDIRANGGKAMALAVDLSSHDGPQELATRTRTIIGDRLDILVFNARLTKTASAERATAEAFDAEFAANVRAPLFLVQELLPVLSRGSRFVVTLEPPPAPERNPASSSVQGGLESLVNELGSSLRDRGIRVDSVMPAGTAYAVAEQPLGEEDAIRSARPAEIARTVTALVSGAA
jgi:Dehydrogenases with different specificities (related to short-chain alcohol dehydrogenases)